MDTQETMVDWQAMGAALRAPFPPESVEWRPQGKTGAGKRVQLLLYIDARDVQDRLDAVCGAGGWAFELEPLSVEGGELRVAKGSLTIAGVVKVDVGTASQWAASKGCASDALNRAAVQFGIARYLYALPPVWVDLDERGHVSEARLAQRRARLAPRAGRAHVQGPAAMERGEPSEARDRATLARRSARDVAGDGVHGSGHVDLHALRWWVGPPVAGVCGLDGRATGGRGHGIHRRLCP